jgi:hypothetical protein
MACQGLLGQLFRRADRPGHGDRAVEEGPQLRAGADRGGRSRADPGRHHGHDPGQLYRRFDIQLEGADKGLAADATRAEAACPEGVPVIPTKRGGLGELLNSAPSCWNGWRR